MTNYPQQNFKISSVQAAERFGITNDYITQLCRRKKITGELIGRVWYIEPNTLEAYIAQVSVNKEAQRKALSEHMRTEYKALVVREDGVFINSVFKKAPSYFWVRPDARVVLAGTALGLSFIFAGVVSAHVVGIAAQAHGPMVLLNEQYQPADNQADILTAAAAVVTEALAVPTYSNTFSPIVPFGPMLNAPAITPDDVHYFGDLFFSSLAETTVRAWNNSFGIVARAVVQSTNELAADSNKTIANELSVASVWDGWTTLLAAVAYAPKATSPDALSQELFKVGKQKSKSSETAVEGASGPGTFVRQALPVRVSTQPAVTPAPIANLAGYVTQNDLAAQLNAMSSSMRQLIHDQSTASTSSMYASLWGAIALSQKIDSLPGTVTINNSPIVTQQSIPALSGISGLLGIGQGGTGTSTAPVYGQLLIGNAAGNYDLVSTSSLGISGGASLTGTTGQLAYFSGINIAAGTSSIFIAPSGFVGVGTTSPGWNFSVVGTTTSSSFYIPGTSSGSGMLTFAGVNSTSVFNQEITHQVSGNNATLLFNLNHGSLPGSNENNTIRFNGPNTSLEAVNANDSLGIKMAESWSTGFLGLVSTGGSSGSVPGGGFLLSFALGNNGKVGSIVPSTSYVSPNWRNVLDDGSGKMIITGLSTLSGGLISQASSTIGSGTQAGGLTINGGATTTGNAYFSGSKLTISNTSVPASGIIYFGNSTANFGYDGSNFNVSGGGLLTSSGSVVAQAGSNLFGVGVKYDSGQGTYWLGASNSSSPDLVFSNNAGTERMRITDAGLVGIGTASPFSNLAIAQTSTSTSPFNVYNYQPSGFTVVTLTYTAGTTWTKPANLDHVVVELYGAGGGSAGTGGTGGTGGNSTFTYNSGGTTITAGGGSGASSATGGAGGTASGGDTNTNGSTGVAPISGGNGGAAAGPAGGAGGTGVTGSTATNGGAAPGGGGGGLNQNGSGGAGGGGGAYASKTLTASQLGSSETIQVGGGGGGGLQNSGGNGNTSGAGGGGSGGGAGNGTSATNGSTTGGGGASLYNGSSALGGAGGTAGNVGGAGQAATNQPGGGGGGGAGVAASLSADGVNYTYSAGGAGGAGGSCTGGGFCYAASGGGGGGGAAGGNGGAGNGTGVQGMAGGAGGKIIITEYIASSGNVLSSNPSLAVSTSGSVGFGTSTPFAKFALSLNTGEAYTGNNAFIIASSTSNSTTTLFSISNTGNVGIGTSTPYARLTVVGTDTASTSSFIVVNSASTTVFSILNNGNATYSGSIFQSSDQRLKTDILSLDASSSLAEIVTLNPVTYLRIDQSNGGQNIGFIAQEVQKIFPDLVSTTSPTTLTPDGTLTLNYVGLIAPIVKSIQALYSIVQGFAVSFTTKQLCVSDDSGSKTCITKTQLDQLLSNAASSQNGSGSSSSGSSDSTSTPDTTEPVIMPDSASSTPQE